MAGAPACVLTCLAPVIDATCSFYQFTANDAVPMLVGLPPVVDERTRIVILGSFPGEASLAAKQYYAHPRNQFWRLMSAVIGEPLADTDYDGRLARLLAHQIGLWDTVAACKREGSLDAAIRQAQANELSVLERHCPHLVRVCFNGKTSGKSEQRFRTAGFDTLVLPSSSPANAQMSFDDKLTIWQKIGNPASG
jgi:TDG/mug DNA glycosylase family protein